MYPSRELLVVVAGSEETEALTSATDTGAVTTVAGETGILCVKADAEADTEADTRSFILLVT